MMNRYFVHWTEPERETEIILAERVVQEKGKLVFLWTTPGGARRKRIVVRDKVESLRLAPE